MSLVTYFGIYFLVWWIVFYLTLPFKISTIQEEGVNLAGQSPSAPVKPRLLTKIIITSIVSFIIVFLVNFFIRLFDLNIYDILFIAD
ncbi:MAG: DUF1467 family protein [Alphaproteobacteria bacterium]|jgi:predicted secreted protein|tara:strand:+ start:28024 stop:28284 length:261 start_codon:yes stop_codon:yes gene_type:complete